MPYSFYNDPTYKKKQSEIAKINWRVGKYNSLTKPLDKRFCKNPNCNAFFFVKSANPKKYCSHSCSATITNTVRVRIKKKCLNCLNPVKRSISIYCSLSCQQTFRYKNYIVAWKNGQKDGNIGITTRVISTPLRRYLQEKYGQKCSICGWDKNIR